MTDDKTIIRVINSELVKRRYTGHGWCWSSFLTGLAVGIALACIVARIAGG